MVWGEDLGGQIDHSSSPNSLTDYTTHITLGKLLSSLGLVPVCSMRTAELATVVENTKLQ